ncbi:hypothetical protein BJ508DRAFT_35918 [Ascobolus immersus RN42]|uniref:Uncharacterized protein n=1 Tax=Ascobolus immersus RN42 TaxID=1160509 RepID=A0A3N4HKD8_ASCIM|nr:hypothetical protein BJ508DRAFT_35918 [Ascobolus immersus RN42]
MRIRFSFWFIWFMWVIHFDFRLSSTLFTYFWGGCSCVHCTGRMSALGLPAPSYALALHLYAYLPLCHDYHPHYT